MCLILMLNFGHQNIPSVICHWFNRFNMLFNLFFEKRPFFPVKTSFSHSHGFFQISRVFSQPWNFGPQKWAFELICLVITDSINQTILDYNKTAKSSIKNRFNPINFQLQINNFIKNNRFNKLSSLLTKLNSAWKAQTLKYNNKKIYEFLRIFRSTGLWIAFFEKILLWGGFLRK